MVKKAPKDGDTRKRATPNDALTAYLSIDRRHRSVNKTQKALLESGNFIVPSLGTLKKWYREDSWPDVAIEHDYLMAQSISEKLVEIKAADYAEMAKKLYEVGGLALNRVALLLRDTRLQGFQELDVDCRVAMMMIQAGAILEGRIDHAGASGLGAEVDVLENEDMAASQAQMDDALKAFERLTSSHSVQHSGNGKGNGHG